MPLFEENNQKNNNQQSNTNQTDESCGFDTQKQNNQTPPKSSLLTIIGQLLPLAPFAFEQFTGQKVPHMTGTIADMQMALNQISTNLQTIANHQQQLNQRLITLENNAVQQLTSLSQQFNSLRLTHTQEKKQIEFNPNPKLENTEDY